MSRFIDQKHNAEHGDKSADGYAMANLDDWADLVALFDCEEIARQQTWAFDRIMADG